MIYTLRIEKMIQGGDGMTHLPDGRVCFVSGALPQELCKIQITFQKKDFTRGRVLEVLESSKDRVQPKCSLYEKCGGCSLQHLDSSKQIEYLEQVEKENFRRLAHANLPSDFKIHSGKSWGYRNRARIICAQKDNSIAFGFRSENSNEIVCFEKCPVLTAPLNDFINNEAKKIFKNISKIANFRKGVDVNLFDNGEGKISYYYKGMPEREIVKKAIALTNICGKEIESDASVFFQSNLSLLPELVNAVKNAADEGLFLGEASDEWLIDLFSGVGFFATLLQDRFKRITTVERDENCLKHANVNLSGKNIENISSPAEFWLQKNVVNIPATLIVDPPRTGLSKEIIEAIIKSSVKQIIYVSCNPVTLARDYAKFAESGFSLKRAEGFAFYPQTPHLEMLFVLVR